MNNQDAKKGRKMMNSDFLVISNISSEPRWKDIYNGIMNHCNRFEIIYTEDELEEENRFILGKKEFQNLSNVTINTWSGMINSIIISGDLTPEAKKIFFEYTSPSYQGGVNELWYYKIYKDDILYMNLEDFSVCLLMNHQDVLDLLEQIGVSLDSLDD